jgi:hypothetical protein
MSTSHTSQSGRRQTARSTLNHVAGPHQGRLEAPRKAVGHGPAHPSPSLLLPPMALTHDSLVCGHTGVEEALSASSPLSRPLRPFRYLKGRLEPARQLATPMGMASHAELTSRPVQSAESSAVRSWLEPRQRNENDI